MNIQEIKITQFPLVIITDTHTNIRNIELVRTKHPDNPIICLGDITFLYSKPGETWNHKSIDYFIQNKIPCLKGNHDEHLVQCSLGNSFTKIMPKYDEGYGGLSDADIYDLTQQQIDYLKKLPDGFRLTLPDKTHYLAYHNRPDDRWSFTEPGFTKDSFLKYYPIKKETRAVLIGHQHRHFVIDYPGINTKLIGIGRLSKNGDYALLTENGIEFKKL